MRQLFFYKGTIILCFSLLLIAQDYPSNMKKYLLPGKFINSDHPSIINKMNELLSDERSPVKKAKILYEFVRDRIREGYIGSTNASDVLAQYGIEY